MQTFQITIQRMLRGATPESDNGYPVIAVWSQSGADLPVQHEGSLQLDELTLRKQVSPRDYGTVLGRAVFRDDLRDLFARAHSDSDEPLHVLLSVEARELQKFHWERLCAPADGAWDFLCLNQQTPFSFYLPSVTDRRFPPFGRRDLRALLVVANPQNLPAYQLASFDDAATIAGVRAALGEIPCGVLTPPTLDALCERITDEPYTLLHVVCHGRIMRDSGEAVLYLADADNQVSAVEGTVLLERLRRLKGARGLPHCAFLSTCESASPEAEDALGGLAQRLVRELGMPAVVAMTERVSIATAQALAAKFYERLRVHGEVDRALSEATAGLMGHYDITVPALYSRLGGQALFSDERDEALLTNSELAYALERLEKLLAERAPVLQSEFSAQANVLRQTLNADVGALSVAARTERGNALAAISSLCLEVTDLKFDALALGQDPPAYDARPPFRGLYPFRAEDREFFFGRETLSAKLQQKLRDHNFLAVLGPSGSGKSSLVLAGLIPLLQKTEPALQFAYLTPTHDPIAALNSALSTPNSTLLVVDQFEELFTLCADDLVRRAFIARLLALAQQQRVIITMRADFWGECAPHTNLKEEMQAHQELIASMDANELRRAMVGQAQKVGLAFEADLSETMLDDVQGEPGAMPLLQHALLELWRRRHGRWLRAEEYRALGGVQRAIARTADEVYDKLTRDEQTQVRNIFVRLTQLDPGAELRDTRRRVELLELTPAQADPTKTRQLVQRLADAHLVVTSVNAGTQREEVEVAHEALIRYWPRLRGWLEADRESIVLQNQIRDDAAQWNANRRDTSYLYTGTRLDIVGEHLAAQRLLLSASEQSFVETAIAQREAERRARRRRLRLVMGGLTAAALVFAVLALIAVWQAGIAVTQQRLSRSRELAALALNQMNVFPERALLLALEANLNPSVAQTFESEDALRQSLLAWGGRAILRGHTGAVNSAQFSCDGQSLVTASDDGTARVWNFSDAREILQLRGHTGALNFAEFSCDGKFIVTAGDDKTVRVWDARAGKELFSLRGHTEAVRRARFSRDGKYIVTASADGTARVWNAASGAELKKLSRTNNVNDAQFSHDGTSVIVAVSDNSAYAWAWASADAANPATLSGAQGPVYGAAISPDNQFFATVSADRSVRVYRADDPLRIPRVLNGHTDIVLSVQFSPDSQRLLTASRDQTARIWDIASGREIAHLTGHADLVAAAAYSSDARFIVTASHDRTAIVWDAGVGRAQDDLRGHAGALSEAHFSPDGKRVVTASEDGTARIWNSETGATLFLVAGHTDTLNTARFSPDGKLVATSSTDKTARVWDAETGKLMTTLNHPDWVWSAEFSPDNKYIVTAGRDGTARVWDVATGAQLAQAQGHNAEIRLARLSPAGNQFLTVGEDFTARVWETATGKPIAVLQGHSGRINAAQFSPDAKRIVSASDDRTVRVWDATNGKELLVYRGHTNRVLTASFSHDGKFVVSAGVDQTARVWDATTGQERAVMQGHLRNVNAASFSPADARVVTASDDGTVRLWDAADGRELSLLRGHADRVYRAEFSPDGTRVVTASQDGTARIHFVALDAILAQAQTRILRLPPELTCDERRQYLRETLACPTATPKPARTP